MKSKSSARIANRKAIGLRKSLLNSSLKTVIIKEIYAQLERISAQGTTLVIVEQDIKRAMAVSDHVYCIREGRVVLDGRPRDLGHEEITKAYFGM